MNSALRPLMLAGLALLPLALAKAAPPSPAPGGPLAPADAFAMMAARGFPALQHVGIIVGDMDKALADVRVRFGLDPSRVIVRQTVQVTDALYQGRKVDYAFEVSLVELGNSQIEYIRPISGPSPYADALARAPGGSIHHLAFATPSVDRAFARVHADNPATKVVLDAHIAGGIHYIYVDGVIPGTLVEYVESAPPR